VQFTNLPFLKVLFAGYPDQIGYLDQQIPITLLV